ncbi:MAG: phospholipase [Bacteroidaceae bacterium]
MKRTRYSHHPKKKKTLWAAACLLLAMAMPGRAQSLTCHKSEVQGSYDFWFYDPQTIADENAHYPLLIFLHGASLCGRNMEKVKRYGPISALQKGRCIDSYIVSPQNPGGAWNPQKIMRIVDWASQKYAVDTTRIYVYGMSLGGYGTIDLAATYPHRIAAAMAICGGGSVDNLEGLARLPLWIIHGTADRAVPIAQSDRVAKAIKDTGDDSRLIYTRLKGVDHGRPARIFYLMQTYDWLFSHSLRDEDRAVCRDFTITVPMLNAAYQDLGSKSDFHPEVFE